MCDTSNTDRLVAQIKWFNPTSGYGFATVKSDGDHKDTDIFVHHSSIQVERNQYKYLKKGEYVTLTVEESNSNDHKYQGVNVRGILEGKLMCEVLNDASTESKQNEGGWERQGRGHHRSNRRNSNNHNHNHNHNHNQNQNN